MKKLIFALFAFYSIASVAQNNSEIELYQSLFKTEKKALVLEYMSLSESESTAFWPIYNAYEVQRSELGKQRITLLQKYADVYESMTDEDASALLKQNNSFQSSQLKLKNSYTKKMQKAVGAKRAMQWLQLEMYLERQIGLYVMENVPFIGELD